MSLQTRLAALVTEFGSDVKSIRSELRNGRLVNPGALKSWQAALGKQALTPAKVVVVGDSITEGAGLARWESTWPLRLQDMLRSRKGVNGGLGYVASSRGTWEMSPSLPILQRVASNELGSYGLGGRSTNLNNSTNHILEYAPQVCDRIRVWYGKTNYLGGNFEIFIDDVSQGLVSSYGEVNGDGFFWDSAPLTRAPHTIRFRSPTGWIGIVDGVEFFDGDYAKGIHVYNAGHFGYRTDSFTTTNMQRHWEHVWALNPQLGIIALGTNDFATSGMTASTYSTRLNAVINSFPAATAILLVMMPQRGDQTGSTNDALWNDMKSAAATLATGKVAMLDIQPWWPKLGSTDTTWEGLMADAIHPNDGGADAIADLVCSAIDSPIFR